jgi:hypothetical protein
MAILDATVGGVAANAYCTVSAATALLTERLATTPWLEADATSQAAALMWATDLLETQVRWYGHPTTTTQALAWPMTGQVDHLGRSIPANVIPSTIQRATATYALALLDETTDASPEAVDVSLVKSRKVGDTQITYHDPRTQPTTAAQTRPATQGMPAEVRAMLRPYGQMSGGLTVQLLRT